MAKVNEFGIWSWVAVSVACGAAVAITEFAGLRGKWEDVIVFTVLLFAMLISLYRPRWGSMSFWWKLLLIFILHFTQSRRQLFCNPFRYVHTAFRAF
jgi:hypothetical protein